MQIANNIPDYDFAKRYFKREGFVGQGDNVWLHTVVISKRETLQTKAVLDMKKCQIRFTAEILRTSSLIK